MRITDRSMLLGDDYAIAADTGVTSLHTAELRAEAVGSTVDVSAAIDTFYLNYVGRHATQVEILSLATQVANGARTLDGARADVVTSYNASTYLPGAISSVYQLWGNRAATTAEIAVWTNEMTIHGATLATVRNAVLSDPLGKTYTSGIVTQAYQQWGGRAPTAAELAAWQNQFQGGLATPSSVQTAVQTDPLGINYATGIITQAYQQWGGRAPTASDIGTWLQVLRNGGSFDQIKAGILAAPLGQDYMAAQITQAYQAWGGRAPTSDEIGTWKNEIVNHGASFDTVKQGIVADPLGITYLDVQITQAYQQWGGRAPTTQELATWRDTIAYHNGTLATVKGDILADPLGTTYATTQLANLFATHGWGATTQADADALLAQLRSGVSFADAAAAVPHHNTIDPSILTHIYEGFSAFLGRAPTTVEANAWSTSVQADGAGLAALRTALLAGSEGQTYVATQVNAAFQQLAGRAATPTEIAYWQDAIGNGGDSFDAMRHAVINTPDGHTHASASITALFSAYLDRAPTAAEMQVELDGLAQGRTIEGIAGEVFGSADGTTRLTDQLGILFPQLLGHQATQTDYSDWLSALFNGATYDTMRATLMLDPASLAHRNIGTTADDRFVLGANPGDVVVSAFDAGHDRIVLDPRFQSINLLDAAHATQVLSLDGETPNVLIRLDSQDTLLLHGVTLAQLSSSDFVFG